MDTAMAAAQSDPNRNQQFRRRWCEPAAASVFADAQRDQIGTLGHALLEAFRRREAERLESVASDGEGPQR